MCYTCYIRVVDVEIAHRELRNRSGEILRAVESGESYTVTNRGRAVARLVPITRAEPDLPLHRAATIRGGFSELRRHVIARPSAETIDHLRGDR